MEVMEEGNLMDRVPILLQRDLEYYQKNHTVLSETVCLGVVGGRLDFPRNASFASVKMVMWWEEEFVAAFRTGSGLFSATDKIEKVSGGIVKTSDPDKFVLMTIKSADMLLDHLHVLAQEALDHADLPVLTATLGAAALVKNSIHCYMQMAQQSGSAERKASLQACYKRYGAMAEAVAERLLDLHVRLLSLYLLQEAGGRPIDDEKAGAPETGSPSVNGWWLYMQGTRRDLWETVPPKIAQRIFAGMLNETLTILTVRYCQTNTNINTTQLLVNDVLNILLCTARLLPSMCGSGTDLAGLGCRFQSRDVRDIHAKCAQLLKCMILRGAPLHFIHKEFKSSSLDEDVSISETPACWYTFVSPNLFPANSPDVEAICPEQLQTSTAIALELQVLLAQPQPSWSSLVKVLTMRSCRLTSLLMSRCVSLLPRDHDAWPASGLWLSMQGGDVTCKGFLCTADGFCKAREKNGNGTNEYASAMAALTHIVVAVCNKQQIKDTLLSALENSPGDWAACLDRRQIWCKRRPPWLAGILALAAPLLSSTALTLINAVQTGASMYQTMSLCLTCLSRMWSCFPRSLLTTADILEEALPGDVTPTAGSILLQLLVTALYEELQNYAAAATVQEARETCEQNGLVGKDSKNLKENPRAKDTFKGKSLTSQISQSHYQNSDCGSFSTESSVALAVAEALCSIDEDNKHTEQIQMFLKQATEPIKLSSAFGWEDFPQFSGMTEKDMEIGSFCPERQGDAAAVTGQLLMTSAGRDSLRVLHGHLASQEEKLYKDLGVQEYGCDDEKQVTDIPLRTAPLLYIMFHIGRQPFDQYMSGMWNMHWSRGVVGVRRSGVRGSRPHISRRIDLRPRRTTPPAVAPSIAQLAPGNRQAVDSLLRVFNLERAHDDP